MLTGACRAACQYELQMLHPLSSPPPCCSTLIGIRTVPPPTLCAPCTWPAEVREHAPCLRGCGAVCTEMKTSRTTTAAVTQRDATFCTVTEKPVLNEGGQHGYKFYYLCKQFQFSIQWDKTQSREKNQHLMIRLLHAPSGDQ